MARRNSVHLPYRKASFFFLKAENTVSTKENVLKSCYKNDVCVYDKISLKKSLHNSLLVKDETFNSVQVFGEPPGCLEGNHTPVTWNGEEHSRSGHIMVYPSYVLPCSESHIYQSVIKEESVCR